MKVEGGGREVDFCWETHDTVPMASKSHKIDVFTSPMCDACHRAIEYFTSRGLTVAEYEVRWDAGSNRFMDSENGREYYRRCGPGVDFVPQIFIDDTHIKGWKKLSDMIDSGQIDELLS